ncbi:fimbrial protein [Pseudomonas sp. PSKL.D1]|uniref:fimbrial protein n=1 Tax=Pseudomonas sp. PSKL.D1 TaxID=3029060 RepID=UPI00238142A3|nr:fimbrial protein [Pseudomonas sp. PSKL.D1]WDY59760.1 fimbrial protein [Pseudomonas sp. PSKL.D1]
MNTFSKTLLASCCVLLAGVSTAQADYGEISLSGRVLAPTCTINGGNGNLPVSLPDVNAARLVNPGQTEGPTPFVLNLSNCSPGISRVSTYFEPGATISPEGRLIVDAGGSTNVQVELLNDTQAPMNLAAPKGSQNSQVVAIVGGNATLNYTARYYSTGATTPGLVTTRVQYSLDYP